MQVNLIGPQIKELFDNSRTALIILGEGASVDSNCLAASLVELFVSYKKEAVLVTKTPLPEAAKPLVKPEQLQSQIEPKSLVLSFDWQKAGLEKVTYKIDGEKFKLIIHSKGRKLKVDDIEYLYQGNNFDVIITIGVKKLEELLTVGLDEETFTTLPTINIDRSLANTNFAKINLVNENTDSLCALTVKTLTEGKVPLPTRAAETLFFGMKSATNNFSDVSDPVTFEAAAVCKRAMIPTFTENSAPEATEKTQETVDENAPEAWLQPKVFRSRGLG